MDLDFSLNDGTISTITFALQKMNTPAAKAALQVIIDRQNEEKIKNMNFAQLLDTLIDAVNGESGGEMVNISPYIYIIKNKLIELYQAALEE